MSNDDTKSVNRRRMLSAAGTTFALSIAGCLEGVATETVATVATAVTTVMATMMAGTAMAETATVMTIRPTKSE